MEPDLEFFRGKSVLVTGHTGFKGAWLSEWLLRHGANVAGMALPPDTEPALFRLLGLEGRMPCAFGDVRDRTAVARVFAEHEPEIVFHLAAQPLVRRSYREPLATFETNVMGTLHVLEAARTAPSVRSIVVVTSDKCYENVGARVGYRESDALGGHDPYSASKGAAEIATAAYRRSFFAGSAVGLATARAGNVIGGGDWSEDRLVPDIVRGVEADRSVPIRNPGAIRPWQHVLDPLSGYLMLARAAFVDPGRFSGAFNFGPDQAELSVGGLASRIVERLGRGSLDLSTPPGDAPHEAELLVLDSTKAREVLAWSPRLGTDDTVALTVEWYRSFSEDRESARAVTERQLAAYETALGARAP
jgi:CDP-glucose 4,6-dehydratase